MEVTHHRILKTKHPSELIKDLDENSSHVRLHDPFSMVKRVTIKLPDCYACHFWFLFKNIHLLIYVLNFKLYQTHNPYKIILSYSEQTAILNTLIY